MNDSDLAQRVLALFLEVAPDVDPHTLQPEVPFRKQFDFDSMDTLNFALELHKAFGLEIPESDYGHLTSLSEAVAYVRSKMRTADTGS